MVVLIFGWQKYNNSHTVLADGVDRDLIEGKIDKRDFLGDEDVVIPVVAGHFALRAMLTNGSDRYIYILMPMVDGSASAATPAEQP